MVRVSTFENALFFKVECLDINPEPENYINYTNLLCVTSDYIKKSNPENHILDTVDSRYLEVEGTL